MIKGLREALKAELDVPATLNWFRQEYLPEVLERINRDGSRKTMALYGGERLRTNERNLTDTRTRLGLLLEHNFTRISNEILVDEGVDDLFWNYVVANRFPDLEVHSIDGSTHIRIEMKALESRAEEKSANFATLIKDIDPETDYLIVCLWQWDDTPSASIAWDSAVRVEKIYVFHAYSLARIRDYNWLNHPPKNCKAYQGIDIRTAVTCNAAHFSTEEHNMGKILRLWSRGRKELPVGFSDLEQETLESYLQFVDEVYYSGFKLLSVEILKSIGGDCIEYHTYEDASYPESRGVAVVPREVPFDKEARRKILNDCGAGVVVKMKNNYQCVAWSVGMAAEMDSQLFDNTKPKNAAQKLIGTGLLRIDD
ncbi:MAG: hypothetical protein Q4B77_06460 [Coriobacteriaceae bacterium]|nr:hypothetical protein [Coriobacteriaceae bacterium]